jgi:hypothetical protein
MGFIDKKYIVRHSDTLYSLVVGRGQSDINGHFSAADLEILKACTKPKWLGTNFPVIAALVAYYYPSGAVIA